MRKLLSYLRQEGQWKRLVALSRAYRWAELDLPPADGGRTRLAPPRDSALAPVTAAVESQQWEDGLLAAEKAFLEPGGQFCFALQRHASRCADALGLADVARRIEAELGLLLNRMPGLPELRFSDDRPFADAADRAWLERTAIAGDSVPAGGETGAPERNPLDEARGIAGEQGLAAGLARLGSGGAVDGRDAARCTIDQARLCLEHGRVDVARPALERLVEEITGNGIEHWDRELAVQALTVLQRAVAADPGELGADERAARLSRIRGQLGRLDMAAALTQTG
jgi:type VI secretion system protein VasJ